jgi:hypothetical protein
MAAELAKMDQYKVWEVVDRQQGMRVVGARWVYTRKIDGNTGQATSYKARWVIVSLRDTVSMLEQWRCSQRRMGTVRRRIYAAHLTVCRGINLTVCRGIIEQLEQVEIDAFPTAFVTYTRKLKGSTSMSSLQQSLIKTLSESFSLLSTTSISNATKSISKRPF